MEVILLGGGTSSLLHCDIIGENPTYKIIGYCAAETSSVLPYPHLGNLDQLLEQKGARYQNAAFALTIAGDVSARRYYFDRMVAAKRKLISVISKHAFISPSAKLGEGCYVGPFSAILPNSQIGAAVQVEDQCSIGVNVRIGDCSVICPGVVTGSYSVIGKNCFVGLGTTINPSVKIGENCLIGASSAAVKNIPANSVAKGVPCVSFRDNPPIS